MPTTARGKAFEDHEPHLTEEEIEKAKSAGQIAVSFKGTPVLHSTSDIGFMAIKFVLADGTSSLVLLDRFSGDALQHLLETVKKIGWKADAMIPKGSKH